VKAAASKVGRRIEGMDASPVDQGRTGTTRHRERWLVSRAFIPPC